MIKDVTDFIKLSPDKMLKYLKSWDKAYYNDSCPFVSDDLYDQCRQYYKIHVDANLSTVPGQVDNSFQKFTHLYPVLSLDKITAKEQFDAAIKKYDNNILVEPKIDGLTVVYYPDGKLVSRGNGIEGEILPYAYLLSNLPKPIDKPVRMEVYIAKVIFDANFANSNKNARNMASGILRRKTYSEDIKFLSYIAYNILGTDMCNKDQLIYLKDHGFNTVDFITIENGQSKDDIYNRMENWSKSFPFETDGIVIKSNEPNSLIKYGSTGHHPNDMIAFKFQSLATKTILREIEWSYGRDCITPVAIFDPIELGGTTVSRASVHNVKVAQELKLAIGSEIIVTKKNEIIPQIISCASEKFTLEVPKVCAKCGKDLTLTDNGILKCTNIDCPSLLLSHCEKMSSKDGLNIMGLSTATWEKIIAEKDDTYTPFDFIDEAQANLNTKIGRYGLTSHVLNKLYQATIKAATECPMHRFLVACDIPLLGRSIAKELEKRYDGNIFLFLSKFAEDDRPMEGLGRIIRQSIVDHLPDILKQVNRIITFKLSKKENAVVSKFKIAITGTLSHPRKYYEELITANGHEFCSSLTKKTNYLVCGEACGSKRTKAEQLGVNIIDEAELMRILEEGK